MTMDEQGKPQAQQPPGQGQYYYPPPPYQGYGYPQQSQQSIQQPIQLWDRVGWKGKIIAVGLLLVLFLFAMFTSCHSLSQPLNFNAAKSNPTVNQQNPPSADIITAERQQSELELIKVKEIDARATARGQQLPPSGGQPGSSFGTTGGTRAQDPDAQFWHEIKQAKWKRDAEAPYASGVGFVTRIPREERQTRQEVGKAAWGESDQQQQPPTSAFTPGSTQQEKNQDLAREQSEESREDLAREQSQEHNEKPMAAYAAYDKAEGPRHQFDEGTILDLTLENELEGEFTGPVICYLSNDIYDASGLHLLIPAGAKVIGQAQQVMHENQRRLAVTFQALIMPDHFRIDLTQFPALDQIGASGLQDKIDNHFLTTFVMAGAVGAIDGLSQIGNSAISYSPIYGFRQGVSNQEGQSAQQILGHYLNRMPTLKIRAGHRIKLYLRANVSDIPEYANHHMPLNF